MRSPTIAWMTALLVVTGTRADEPKPTPTARPIAEKLAEMRAEHEARREAYRRARKSANGRVEKQPDEIGFSRRMLDLAETSPADPSSRDALTWVIRNGADGGPYGDLFGRAGALLVRHHGDDPEAIRIGLDIGPMPTLHKDALVSGFYAAAKGREAKGLARFALAQYLLRKADFVAKARNTSGRPRTFILRKVSAEGKLVRQEVDEDDERYAYHLLARTVDPEALRAEAKRLFEEVVSDYSEIWMTTTYQRRLEALLKEPAPVQNGKPLKADERRELEAELARKETLGEVAGGYLYAMRSLVIGKPAPEIVGTDAEGKPIKLSDYRGKVVVLSFWASWCGPCMAQVPHERGLVDSLKGRPFALLGVNCQEEMRTAREVMEREKMTWPSWHEGTIVRGPIAMSYHVWAFPSVFVLDTKGVIRAISPRIESLDQVVNGLMKEVETATPGPDNERPAAENNKKPDCVGNLPGSVN